MKKYALILLIATASFSSVYASHFMGGEITWECLPNGNFRFILKVYRECGGILYPTTGITMTSNSPAGNIQMRMWPNTVDGIRDISPPCNPDPFFTRIKCLNSSPPQASNKGAVEEWTYTTDQLYPNGVTLNAVPPPTGWVFAYTSCCRNPSTNITNSSSKSWYLRSIMYPYNNTSAYPCFDDAPAFHAPATTVLCAGYPYSYNAWVTDKQGDSLAFSWNMPLETSLTTPITSWGAGYAYNSPFPGPYQNPLNVAASVHPQHGSISLTSFTQGAFINCLSVEAYRGGIKIAEVFREMQVVITACGSNLPPQVTMPGTQPDPYFYTDTFYIGDQVSKYIQAYDSTPLVLANGQLTKLSSMAYSEQFGAGYTSTTSGCRIPPCATLTPPCPATNTIGISHQLVWDITWDHWAGDTLSHPSSKGVYDFFFHFRDDYCPAPADRYAVYRIVVSPPKLYIDTTSCLTRNPAGDLGLTWSSPQDPDTAFSHYLLSYGPTPAGPFTGIDTITGIHQTQYLLPAALQPGQAGTYQLEAVFVYLGHEVKGVVFKRNVPAIAGPSTSCKGSSIWISYPDAVSTDTLNWDFGQATVLSGSGAGPYQIRIDTTGSLTLTLEKKDHCGTVFMQKHIIVHPLPVIEIAGNKYYCPGSPVELTASGGVQYLWSNGSINATMSIPSVNSPATYHVTVTDANQCSNTASAFVRAINTYQDSKICMVSNDITNNTLHLVWDPPMNQDIREYQIYWSDVSHMGQWALLDSLDLTQSGYYIDNQHSPSNTQYFFALRAEDSCGIRSNLSPAAAPMFLQANKWANSVMLSWLPYHELDFNYHTRIHRYDSTTGIFQILDSVPKFSIAYTDLFPPLATLQYYVSIASLQCAPFPGSVYTETFSNIITVNNSVGMDAHTPAAPFSVNQDNINQCLVIQRNSVMTDPAEVMVLDMTGRVVAHCGLPIHGSPVILSTSHLGKGMYLYVISTDSNRIQQGKVMVYY